MNAPFTMQEIEEGNIKIWPYISWERLHLYIMLKHLVFLPSSWKGSDFPHEETWNGCINSSKLQASSTDFKYCKDNGENDYRKVNILPGKSKNFITPSQRF